MTPTPARELFIYWTVPAAHAAQAAQAVRATQAMQRALLASHAGLQAQLFRRADDARPGAGDVTVMETYAHPSGVSAVLQAAIAAAAVAALAGLPLGPRHVEAFDRLPPPH